MPSLSSSLWKYHSVEWNPKVASVLQNQDNQLNASVSHFVLPDLSTIYSQNDRVDYLFQTPTHKRILTVATCRYTAETIANTVLKADKVLLVGGNEKIDQQNQPTLSTIEAAKILREQHNDLELWGVTNPNDPNSCENVQKKIEAGISGFITQPLLSSNALQTLEDYPREDDTVFVAGVAMPRTAKSLQFWRKLLEQPDLEEDPLFRAHLAFFSQPYFTPMAWIGREVENLSTHATVDGVHFMPMGNTEDLLSVFRHI